MMLEFYRKNFKKKPEKIVFYRDGVSEGQFQSVSPFKSLLCVRSIHSVNKFISLTHAIIYVQSSIMGVCTRACMCACVYMHVLILIIPLHCCVNAGSDQ